MTEITINFNYILAVMYAAFKVAASIWICKHEFQYPIWDTDGMHIQRGIHHKLQSFLRNCLINPEWGLFKIIAFAPVFLVTGKRFLHAFLPWRIQKTPPFCRQCNDKGKYFVKSFLVGKGGWHICECQEKANPQEASNCSCHVCLDEGTIGKNRPCPHCELRKKSASTPPSTWVPPSSWGELKTNPPDRGNSAQVMQGGTSYRNRKKAPFAYLSWEVFRDDRDWKHTTARSGLCTRRPSELHVGDTVVIRSIRCGHRNGGLLGKSLRILGLNLPFAVVEYDSEPGSRLSRHIDVIDLRGTELAGERPDKQEVRTKGQYQPLLKPASLEVGDQFVVVSLNYKGKDNSFRGEAFRVVTPAYIIQEDEVDGSIPKGTLAIEAEHLSFSLRGLSPTFIRCCEGLQIIPVNDQYIQATKCHCPDIGFV